MRDISEPFENFIEDPEPPSQKRGPLLCQPPSSLTFNVRALDYALRTVRAADEGQIIVEARQKAGRPKRPLTCWRHTRLTGFSPIPPPCGLPKPSTSPPRYVRLHRNPKIYYSAYSDDEIRFFSKLVAPEGWCAFDNTASSLAIEMPSDEMHAHTPSCTKETGMRQVHLRCRLRGRGEGRPRAQMW